MTNTRRHTGEHSHYLRDKEGVSVILYQKRFRHTTGRNGMSRHILTLHRYVVYEYLRVRVIEKTVILYKIIIQ